MPAYDRRGSNCILRRPASIIPLRFGNDSFLPHCEAMKKTGKPLVILEMPGIGLDIDNPHELELLVQRDGDTHAQRLLRSWGIASRRRRCMGSGRLMPSPFAPDPTGMTELHAIPIWGIGDVLPGDSIADLIVEALATSGLRLHAGDILVVKHKIVSKAEGRMVELATVKPSPAAQALRREERRRRPRHRTRPARGQAGGAQAARAHHRDRARLRLRQQRHRRLQRGRRQDRGAAAARSRPLGRPHSSPTQEAHHAAHPGDHRRQLWPRLARGIARGRHRPCRHEAACTTIAAAATPMATKCMPPRSALPTNWPASRAWSAARTLSVPACIIRGYRLSSRQRQRAPNRPPRGQRFVPLDVPRVGTAARLRRVSRAAATLL